MIYFIYSCICFGLVIIQTTIMPFLPVFDNFYDLMCVFIIYLGLFRPAREGLPIVLCFGLLMDNLFGGPFGLYVTTYLWLFIGVKWLITFLQLGSMSLLPLVVATSILFENIIFIGTLTILKPGSQLPANALHIVGVQVLWAIFTGPILLKLFQYSQNRWFGWPVERFEK
ncbi:hypothetical protein ACFL0O_01310 [Thermodesulfobacteriota bacterium]